MGISIDQDKLVDLFLQLVRINATSRQEKPVVDFLKQRLTTLGVSVYEDHAGGPSFSCAPTPIPSGPRNISNRTSPMASFAAMAPRF